MFALALVALAQRALAITSTSLCWQALNTALACTGGNGAEACCSTVADVNTQCGDGDLFVASLLVMESANNHANLLDEGQGEALLQLLWGCGQGIRIACFVVDPSVPKVHYCALFN